MKNITLYISFLIFSIVTMAQTISPEKNSIWTKIYTYHEGQRYLEEIQYFDGLGRPIQTVQKGITPNKADLVSSQEYDDFGRESNSWLPVSILGNNGAYVDLSKIKNNINASYPNDVVPFSKPIYEASPLNRVLEQYGPGNAWHTGKKSVKTFYLTNKGGNQATAKTIELKDDKTLSGVYTSCEAISLKPGFHFKSEADKSLHLYTDPSLCQTPSAMPMMATTAINATMPTLRDEFLKCTNYLVGTNAVVKSGEYNAGELFVTFMIDEDDNQSLEFKNKLGQVVLTRQVNGSEKYDTYYVYDDFGNLRYVIPPKAVDEITNYADSDSKMGQYTYIYKYDGRNRCTQKKLPGAEWIYYVYDKADQLIFTQDGVQRTKGEWTFTIPDALGRIVLTGICKNTLTVGNEIGAVVRASWPATPVTNAYKGYSISGITLATGFSLASVSYYDNYEFLGLNSIPNTTATTQYLAEPGYGSAYGDHQPANKVKSKGLLTGTLTAQLQPNGTVSGYLYSVMYYDNRGRIVQTKSSNHLSGGIEKEYIAYNFSGQPTKKKHVHTATGKTTQTEIYDYTYDHAGRSLTTHHTLNTGAKTLIATNTYDELGRLKSNKKGNRNNLATNYTYNIRSWITSMMNYYQHFHLDYTYGGNIKTQSWKHGGRNHKYTFGYDELSRLLSATYSSDVTAERYGTSYTYDKQGNITTIKRDGKTASGYGPVDNLTFTYNGNQLTRVRDAVTTANVAESADFINYNGDTGLMTYNANGALASDSHKGITSIQYNSLNLPTKSLIKNSRHDGSIEYTYSAGGMKLKTVHNINLSPSSMAVMGAGTYTSSSTSRLETNYAGNKIYENDNLKRILIDGGYIDFTNNDITKPQYNYYLTDHLGNNRMTHKVVGETETLVQRTQYYPFGMAFADQSGQEVQPYKYNGKELDSKLGLNTYDYSARYMDPAIGRFTSMDPLAEKKPWLTPYHYTSNNPINRIDPDGKYDFKNMEDNNNYALVIVLPSSYEKDRTLLKDYDAAMKHNMPLLLVDDVADYAAGMGDMASKGISTNAYSISNHGNTGLIKIGAESIRNNHLLDLSTLKEGLDGKNVFIGQCNVVSGGEKGDYRGNMGLPLLKNFAKQTGAITYAPAHTIRGGFEYDGSDFLNISQPVFGKSSEEKGRTYYKAEPSGTTTKIYDFTITHDGKFKYQNNFIKNFKNP